GSAQGLVHDSVSAQREGRIPIVNEYAVRGIEELGLRIPKHLLGSMAVGFRLRDAISLQERQRGPGVGLELSRQLSAARLELVELEDSLLGDEIAANEVKRAQRDVDEVLPSGGLTQHEERQRGFGIPRSDFIAVPGRP